MLTDHQERQAGLHKWIRDLVSQQDTERKYSNLSDKEYE